jgi:hypothetical protein
MSSTRCLITLVAALALAVTVGFSARADGRSGPIAVAAHFPQTATETVPGSGDGTVQSSELPATAAQATIDVQPNAPKGSDDIRTFDDLTDVVISSFPKFGRLNRPAQRIITCAILSDLYSNVEGLQPGVVDSEPVLQILVLDMCLRVALQLSSQQSHGAVAVARLPACRRLDAAIAIRVTRSGSGYRGQTVGRTRKPSSRSPLSISCRRRGTGFRLTIRPRVRGRKLRQVVGPTVGIAFVNPTNKPVGVRTTFAVR